MRTCWPRSSGWTGRITGRSPGTRRWLRRSSWSARAHQSLIWDRTRHVLRLRAALREFFPAALQAFADLDAPDALELLGHAPDPDRAAAAVTVEDHRGAAAGPAAATSRRRPSRSRPCCGPRRCGSHRRCRTRTPRSSTSEVALIARAQHPDRRAGRGGGRPFWPSPGR